MQLSSSVPSRGDFHRKLGQRRNARVGVCILQQTNTCITRLPPSTCPAQASLLALGCEGTDVPVPPSNLDKSRGGVISLMCWRVTTMTSRRITTSLSMRGVQTNPCPKGGVLIQKNSKAYKLVYNKLFILHKKVYKIAFIL